MRNKIAKRLRKAMGYKTFSKRKYHYSNDRGTVALAPGTARATYQRIKSEIKQRRHDQA